MRAWKGVEHLYSSAVQCGGQTLPELRAPGAALHRPAAGGAVRQDLRAHLLRRQLLVNQGGDQLRPVLVHQLFALVSNGAGQVTASRFMVLLSNKIFWIRYINFLN